MSVAVLLTDCTYLVAVLWAACAAYNGWMLQPVARVAYSWRARCRVGFLLGV